jgi:tetratricopeptide (TPR) repeat protein
LPGEPAYNPAMESEARRALTPKEQNAMFPRPVNDNGAARRRRGDENVGNVIPNNPRRRPIDGHIRLSRRVRREIEPRPPRSGEEMVQLTLHVPIETEYERQIAACRFDARMAFAGNDGEALAEALNDFGVLYLKSEQPKDALAFLQDALKLHRMARNTLGEAALLANIGTAHRSMGKPSKALKHFRQALAVAHDAGHRQFEAQVLIIIGSMYAERRRTCRVAIDCLAAALTPALEAGSADLSDQCRLELKKCYGVLGKVKFTTACLQAGVPTREVDRLVVEFATGTADR